MDVFRITKSAYSQDLTGEGARIHGGRWSKKGVNMLYTSEYGSLAALEILVHTPIATSPADLQMVVISIPDDVPFETLDPNTLPANWTQYPAPSALAERGTEWVQSASSLILKVPSVIIRSEWNFLINPAHSDFSRIRINEIRGFQLDDPLRE